MWLPFPPHARLFQHSLLLGEVSPAVAHLGQGSRPACVTLAGEQPFERVPGAVSEGTGKAAGPHGRRAGPEARAGCQACAPGSARLQTLGKQSRLRVPGSGPHSCLFLTESLVGKEGRLVRGAGGRKETKGVDT